MQFFIPLLEPLIEPLLEPLLDFRRVSFLRHYNRTFPSSGSFDFLASHLFYGDMKQLGIKSIKYCLNLAIKEKKLGHF